MKIMMNQHGYASVVLDAGNETVNTANETPVEGEVTTEGTLVEGDAPAEGTPVEGDAPAEGTPVEGDTPAEGTPDETDTSAEDQNAADNVDTGAMNGELGGSDMSGMDGMSEGGMMDGNMMPGTETAAKGSVMSSWPFVIGISAASLALSVVIGILLAKKRIKKGFDLYED